MQARLALEDGTVLTGRAIGARGWAGGEVVFTTAMTGYEEVLSDPSYNGQIVTMAYPLIGNYGVSGEAWESFRPHVEGFVVGEAADLPHHWQAETTLAATLARWDIPGIAGLDTRFLVRHLRTHGLKRGLISTDEASDAELVARARALPDIGTLDLVAEVSTPAVRHVPGPGSAREPLDRLVPDQQHRVAGLLGAHPGPRLHPVAESQQHPEQLHRRRGLPGDPHPRPGQRGERPVGEEQDAPRARRAADAVGQRHQAGLEPDVVHQRERPGVELARGHGLPEPARDQVDQLHAFQPVKEGLAVEIGNAADAQHGQLQTLTTL